MLPPRGNGLPTIDLQEIYIAALKRNCVIRTYEQIGPVLIVEITEDNGVKYYVRLYSAG